MYVNQWNLSIQRQVGKDWLVSVNYLGTSTIHLPSGESVDPAIFLGLGACTLQTPTGPVNYSTCSTTSNQNQRRLLYLQNPTLGQYFGGIGQLDDGGTGSYEGLNFSAQKRMSHRPEPVGQLHLVALHQRSVESEPDRGGSRHSRRAPPVAQQLHRHRPASDLHVERGGYRSQIHEPASAHSGQ